MVGAGVGLGMSLHVTTPFRKFAKDKLLSQTGSDPFCGTDREITKDKADAAIRSRKIKIRQACCC
jgi:hypothetical protein